MKRILRTEEREISLNDIQDNQAIGIEWELGGNKTIIIRVKQSEFTGLCNESSYLSIEYSWVTSTKQEYVERALKQRKEVSAFVFEDTKELLKWFSN